MCVGYTVHNMNCVEEFRCKQVWYIFVDNLHHLTSHYSLKTTR